MIAPIVVVHGHANRAQTADIFDVGGSEPAHNMYMLGSVALAFTENMPADVLQSALALPTKKLNHNQKTLRILSDST